MRFIFIILLSNLFIFANAQNIKGKIQDEKNKNISEALLFIENNGSSFYNDAKSQFSIPTSNFKSIDLVIFKEGFKEYRLTITEQNYNTFLNIYLQKIEQEIKEVEVIRKKKTLFGYTRMKSIEGTTIYSTKKAEIVDMETINANIANNSSRQIFSKVSGLNIWESDCSGLQLGIGSRGLSPSRTSNFNVRQNGYDISADAIGYPDAYFAPPMQALKSIEVVKGAASLQYGTQFGGLINFKYKDAPKDKKIQLNSSLTYGTNNYLNSFTSLSGTVDKLSYYTYYQYRKGDCWRCNSDFQYHSAFAKVKLQENEKLSFNLEYSYLGYLAQQPGGLTDYLFEQDPQQSIRDRNWFKVFWNLLNLKMDYKISPKTTLNVSLLGQYSGRDASGYLGKISRTDPLTETDLLQDTYTNYIAEARLLQKYNLFGKRMVFVGGIRYMQGTTTKKQGATSNDSIATFKYSNPNNLEGSSFSFPNRNMSVFTENIFNITNNFSLTFGARLEYLKQKASGYYRITNLDFAGNVLLDTTILETNTLQRIFPFFGGGASYKFNNQLEVYSNISQNYRAVGYNDLRITILI
jgi:Fe(3+) dicitrate transport protein